MQDDQKQHLSELLKRQKEQNHQKEISVLKHQIQHEIPDFTQKYQFAEKTETIQISASLRFAEICGITSGWNPAYLCFQYGSQPLFEIYIKGSSADFIRDFEEWEVFSSALLILNRNFQQGFYLTSKNRKAESYEII
ncbi:MAG: hypothetical protein IJ642_10425 [Oscillospiraceae bacterium]|nr:hypothetical protein [Oscillospiraceae bacterium]